MHEKLTSQEINAIKGWKPELFHDRLVRHIKDAQVEKEVGAAMRQMGNQHATDWFKPPKNSAKPRSLAEAKLQTVVRLCMVLDKLGYPVKIDELCVRSSTSAPLVDRIRNLENGLNRSTAFEAVINKALLQFTIDNTAKLRRVLDDVAPEIAAGKTDRKFGHIAGWEVRAICKHCTHIRAITTRMDFGGTWDTLTGKLNPHKTEFKIMAGQLNSIRHTFIVPNDESKNTPNLSPSPFSNTNPITWRGRIDMFREIYLDKGKVDPNFWKEKIVFRHTDLPIPASAALFGLNKSGFDKLNDENPSLIEDLDAENGKFLHKTSDGGAFIGIVIPGSDAPRISTLMNTRSILFTANAFIKYWSNLPKNQRNINPDPRIGLPIGPDAEYQ